MIHLGDCLEVMRGMPEASVDAVVTDPPYGLEFMGKAWDSAHKLWSRHQSEFAVRPNGGTSPFQGRERPNYVAGQSFQAWCTEWGREALRVTRPGGYLLAFGGTRTHHRLVCGLEDAGWIIRDELDWIYASGFPKGKANLKPAHEPIVLARKPGPLRPLGIDAGRIGTSDEVSTHGRVATATTGWDPRWSKPMETHQTEGQKIGRWPSNVLLSDPALFDEPNPYVVGSGATVSSGMMRAGTLEGRASVARNPMPEAPMEQDTYGDTGGYSRFFIIPKSSRSDREPVLRGQPTPVDAKLGLRHGGTGEVGKGTKEGYEYHPAPRVNQHPTCKPTDLMAHLIRLVCPPDGLILDPFLGSGSTAVAAEREGVHWIGIEKEPEYVAIAEARLNGTQRGLGLDVGAPVTPRPSIGQHSPVTRQNKPRPDAVFQWKGWAPDPEEAA